ncbi:hypothetical protein HMPREF0262_03110 [Clostridium sp. ATCC 29733]|nr:hypothetical protein HMPREF0262_03110 [Clostridium sp. ATCC 29733]
MFRFLLPPPHSAQSSPPFAFLSPHFVSAVSSPRSDLLPRSRPALCFAAVRPLLF